MIESSFVNSPSMRDGRFQVSIDLMVHDPAQLWASAAARGSSFVGMGVDDIEDVIGPREDPDLFACLSMLMTPATISGCKALDFTISPTIAMLPISAMDRPNTPVAAIRSISE